MSLRGMLKVHVDGEERKRKQQKEVEGNTPYNRIDEKGRSKVEVEVGSDSEPPSVEDESGQHYAGNDAREEDEALYNNFSDQVEELNIASEDTSPNHSEIDNDNHVRVSEQQEREEIVLKILNTGCMKNLKKLHGVGVKRAQAIMDNRPFHQLNDLNRKGVLGKKLFEAFMKRNVHEVC